MATRHTDPYVRERTEIHEDRSSPMMLIIGLILAVAIAIAAWFAFTGDRDGGTVINEGDTNTQVEQPGQFGEDTGGTGSDTDTGGTDGSGTGDTTTP